ncbi:hypothetical protein A2291_02265 [candidate division WOR-1 bacterium RIFOXYB2_FULL_42_35]|uniref:tRNA (guanine-N(1)-)-methyltransferase C-terminal domain-containing protein n=1 Tax=candidate division WOR-1 bacterium RIFOXYC2_FULL_41_25 TaxID=1802586 RepID=A0A1F4TQN7_UNCSA|nr:MAG: hypothetical protein A2247_02150 [candidate division WOR-1 bacterium RIFOXYA2_FULL_41_14]OGC24855.1 MAG: hypothetical protein A2291_02265 [candidate division WOR-1 bacterium RIFOXYB2_FULL_42_35]OGC35042.1 MAG: hypothetical protein A2462_05885 [candidate division WOR-1 bacterium RIFOXYC2_FULL_41_25]OGC43653.1 MAG: hypothetical protein A2548_07465 [candidate division WOR-1 bacterium RIFOXYD2_FULL_41_8]
MANVYLALLHHPVYNKNQKIVSTCITGFDLHDIARTAITFGIKKYFVVNPLPTQRAFAERIREFWMDDASLEFNWTRAEAFKLISIQETLEQAVEEIVKLEGQKPKIIATSAKPRGTVSFDDLKAEIKNTAQPFLVVLGTGWGLAEEVFEKIDAVLPPILGDSDYNHLSVRAACAIILDRLLGK